MQTDNRQYLNREHWDELVDLCGGDRKRAAEIKRIIRNYERKDEREYQNRAKGWIKRTKEQR